MCLTEWRVSPWCKISCPRNLGPKVYVQQCCIFIVLSLAIITSRMLNQLCNHLTILCGAEVHQYIWISPIYLHLFYGLHINMLYINRALVRKKPCKQTWVLYGSLVNLPIILSLPSCSCSCSGHSVQSHHQLPLCPRHQPKPCDWTLHRWEGSTY